LKKAGEGGTERLLAKELLHNCIFLLNAGHEDETNLIGNGLKCLLDSPDQKERLLRATRPDQDRDRGVPAHRELEQLGNRITTCATEIGGVALGPRTLVTLCIAAAKPRPGAVPPTPTASTSRARRTGTSHSARASIMRRHGLGRLEGRIAIGGFLARFPHYRLAAPAQRSHRVRFRGHVSLPCLLLPISMTEETRR